MSSKRRQRRKACSGKVAFVDETAAVAAAIAARRDGKRLLPYRCPFCAAYHLGHPTKRARQALAARAQARKDKT